MSKAPSRKAKTTARAPLSPATVRDGTLVSWLVDDCVKRFKGQPASDEAARSCTVDSLDLSSAAATTKVTLAHGTMTFIDCLVLLKMPERWKIASKAFHRPPTVG